MFLIYIFKLRIFISIIDLYYCLVIIILIDLVTAQLIHRYN